jgi:ferric-dicitrate binding protein FerR (iron transport regulator)
MAKTGKKEVEVKLYKGKVMVRPSGSTETPVYMMPGDQLTMNAQGSYNKRVANAEIPVPGIVKKGAQAGGDAFSFSNQPLEEVLEQLKQRFHADIRYNTKEIKSIYITASFTQQDTLSDILTILCTLNDLQLKHTDSVFAISR